MSESITATQKGMQALGQRTNIAVRQQHTVKPDIERDGTDGAAVSIGIGCFDSFVYQITDPNAMIGKMVDSMVVNVPVGELNQVVGLSRYNSIARVLDGPELVVPVRTGDPTSYADAAQTLSGAPVAPEQMVFGPTQSYEVGDRAIVRFRRDQRDAVIVEGGSGSSLAKSTSQTLGVVGKLKKKVSFVEIEAKGKVGLTMGEQTSFETMVTTSTQIGERSLWSGSVEPIRDDPTTPEDESALLKFAFAPYVYKERVELSEDSFFEFFVINYVVRR